MATVSYRWYNNCTNIKYFEKNVLTVTLIIRINKGNKMSIKFIIFLVFLLFFGAQLSVLLCGRILMVMEIPMQQLIKNLILMIIQEYQKPQ